MDAQSLRISATDSGWLWQETIREVRILPQFSDVVPYGNTADAVPHAQLWVAPADEVNLRFNLASDRRVVGQVQRAVDLIGDVFPSERVPWLNFLIRVFTIRKIA